MSTPKRSAWQFGSHCCRAIGFACVLVSSLHRAVFTGSLVSLATVFVTDTWKTWMSLALLIGLIQIRFEHTTGGANR